MTPGQLSLKAKIVGMVAFLLVTFMLTMLYAIYAMSEIKKEMQGIAEQDLPLTRLFTEITVNQQEQAIHYQRALRYSGLHIEDRAKAADAQQQELKGFDEYGAMVDNEIDAARELLDKAKAHAIDSAAREEFEHLGQELAKVEATHADYMRKGREVVALVASGDVARANAVAEEVDRMETAFNHQVEELLKEIQKFTQDAALTAEEHENSALRVLIIAAVAALVMGGVVGTWVIRTLTRGLSRAVQAAEQVAAGDLRQPVEVEQLDEVGRVLTSLEVMRTDLRGVIDKIGSSSVQLTTAAEELSVVNEQTSEGLHKQQDEIQQMASAINEMAATVKEVARHTNDAAGAAQDAVQKAMIGKREVNQTIEAIDNLASQVMKAAEAVQALEKESEDIGAVLDVIGGISDQTNLLALNAAIEAARAGEVGRGFAVVADEVRTLATRTRASTQEIHAMITRLQEGARNAVRVITESRSSGQTGVEQAARAGSSLEAINQAILVINDMNTQIATAAEEQSQVTEGINRNIVNINLVAEQNSTVSKETAAASCELANLAVDLHKMLGAFKT